MAGDTQGEKSGVADYQVDEEKVKELVETFDPEPEGNGCQGGTGHVHHPLAVPY
jgi:hypothetical protein